MPEETLTPDKVEKDIKASAAVAGVKEIAELSQSAQDRLMLRVDKIAGDQISGILETRLLEDRPEMIERQQERLGRAIAGQMAYHEASERQPLMGHFFQACAKAGHKTKDLSGQQQFIEESMTRAVGPALAKAVNLGDASEGGLLVEGTVLELWLEPLVAESVVLAQNPEIIPVVGDSFKVTGFDSNPSIVWTEEENTSALTTTPTTGERQTQMRKAMMILPVTADFRESASPAVLRRLERMSRTAFRVDFDLRYITGTGLSNTVKGLLNHITATSGSAGQTVANVLTDAETAWNSIESNNIPVERFAIFLAPRTKNHLMFLQDSVGGGRPIFMDEMKAGTFLGWPFGTTTNIPTNLSTNQSYILWQAMNQFFVGQSTALDLQWFDVAPYTEGGALVSSLERDTNVLRGRMKTATLMPHGTSGYHTSAVVYGT